MLLLQLLLAFSGCCCSSVTEMPEFEALLLPLAKVDGRVGLQLLGCRCWWWRYHVGSWASECNGKNEGENGDDAIEGHAVNLDLGDCQDTRRLLPSRAAVRPNQKSGKPCTHTHPPSLTASRSSHCQNNRRPVR